MRHVNLATLIFSAIAAVGTVMGVWVASSSLREVVERKHRKLDAVIADYEKLFHRLYQHAMGDLDENGHVRQEKAAAFGEIADNIMYLHCGSEAEAWQRYREVHDI